MARPGFLNDNANRTFPFQENTAGEIPRLTAAPMKVGQLFDEVVVDAGFIMGPESAFVEGEHEIYLFEIERVDAVNIKFEFRCTAPELAATPLQFFFPVVSEATYQTDFVESDIPDYEPASQSVSSSFSQASSVCGEPYWSGYVTVFDLEEFGFVKDFLENVGDKIQQGVGDLQGVIEPGLIQNLDQSQVVSLNIANSDRTRAQTPGGCPDNQWDFPTGDIYINRECLQGDIRIRAGYNLALTQSVADNEIQLSGVVNAGLGEPCEEVKLFATETPPVGSTNGLLAGDFYCNEAVRQINGLQGPNFTFFGGTGVSINADQETNTVLINVDLVDLSLCEYSAVSESI